MKFFEEIDHAGVGVGARFPVAWVVILKAGDDFSNQVVVVAFESAFYEDFDPIADVSGDVFLGVRGEAEVSKGVVQSCGDAGEGIDKGAIEIKDESAYHAAAIGGEDGKFEPCFDRKSGLWE